MAAGVAVAGVVVVPRALDSSPDRTRAPATAVRRADARRPLPSHGDVGEGGRAADRGGRHPARRGTRLTAADLPYYPIGNLPHGRWPRPAAAPRRCPGDGTEPMVAHRQRRPARRLLRRARAGTGSTASRTLSATSRSSSLSARRLARGRRHGRRAVVVPDDPRVAPSGRALRCPDPCCQGRTIAWTWDSSRLYRRGLNSGVPRRPRERRGHRAAAPERLRRLRRRGRRRTRHRPAARVAIAGRVGRPGTGDAVGDYGDLGGLNHLTVFDGGIAATRIDLAYGEPAHPERRRRASSC